MTKPLEGQTALITGASRGIGAAIAEALADAGAHVILTARTSGGLEEVEDRIHANGGHATIAPLDLIEAESIGRLAIAVASRWNSLDILVLNAAMLGSLGPVPHIDAKEFANIFALNVSAQQALLAAFDPLLRRSANAKVIGITSSIASRPKAYWGAYGASKAAFEVLLSAYAEENRNIDRVRVAIVDPGATRTQMRARAYPGEDVTTLKGPEVVARNVASLAIDGFETLHRLRVNDSF